MAKSLVIRAIREFVDRWTEGTDWSQLEVRALGGCLALTDLQLSTRPLEQKLGRPVERVTSRVGRLQAAWSWTGLLTTPVRLEASDLNVHIRVRPGLPSSGTAFTDEGASTTARPSRARQLWHRVCDRLQIQVSSMRVCIELHDAVAMQLQMSQFSLLAEPQADGLRQEVRLEGFGLWVAPLPAQGGSFPQSEEEARSSSMVAEAGADAGTPGGVVVEPCTLCALAKRSSGRRFKDLRGLEVELNLQALAVGWSFEQYLAVVRGLDALGLADVWIAPGLAVGQLLSEECWMDVQEDGGEVVLDLSPDDREAYEVVEIVPAEGVTFDFSVSWLGANLRFWKRCADTASLPLLVLDSTGRANFRLSDIRKSLTCELEGFNIRDGTCPLADLPLLALPRPSIATDAVSVGRVELIQDGPRGQFVLDVRLAGIQVSLLPRWTECAHMVQTALEYSRRLLPPDAHFGGQVPCKWSLLVQDSLLAFPASTTRVSAPALFFATEMVTATGQVKTVHNVSLLGVSARLVQGAKQQDLCTGIDIKIEQVPNGSGLRAVVESLEVNISLTQLLVLIDVARSTKRLSPFTSLAQLVVEVPVEVSFQLNNYQISVIDKVGIAAYIGVEVRGFAAGRLVPGEGCFAQLGGLEVNLLGVAQGSREFVRDFKMSMTLNNKALEFESAALTASCNYQTLHSLWYMAHAIGGATFQSSSALTALSMIAGMNDAGGATDDFQIRFRLGLLQVRVDDPQGLCGHVIVLLTGTQLDCQLPPMTAQVGGFELEVQSEAEEPPVAQGPSQLQPPAARACSTQKKAIFALKVSDLTYCTAKHADGLFMSLAAAPIQIEDRRGQSTAITSDGQPVLFEGVIGTVAGIQAITQARLQADIIRIDTSEEFIKACAEACGHIKAGFATLLRTRSLKLQERPLLEVQGAVVTQVSATLEKAGLLRGSTLIKIGQTIVSEQTDAQIVQSLLDAEDLPFPLFFMLPEPAHKEIYLDGIVQPFRLRVDGYSTSSLAVDVQVRKAELTMPSVPLRSWRGNFKDLRSQIGRVYAQALGTDMPWLLSASKMAGLILAQTMAHNMGTSVRRFASQSTTAGIVQTFIERGKVTRGRSETSGYQFGDVTVGIFASGTQMFNRFSDHSPMPAPRGGENDTSSPRRRRSGLQNEYLEDASSANAPLSPRSLPDSATTSNGALGSVLSKGKASRGAASGEAYKFGDFSRGLFSMVKR
mmetsp:Transcript_18599/g.43535  ORF Transcript_18599/g.43535 Transcript_18599/m.43535 type:complete len:1217 (-) Transcript_18599:59-3709(-)